MVETGCFTVARLPDVREVFMSIMASGVLKSLLFGAMECWTAVFIRSIQAGLILFHRYIPEHKIPIENSVFPRG
jgi:hypothetical protein